MTIQELEKLAMQAGFRLVTLESPFRTIFTRGENTLLVWKEGKWACYVSVGGGKRPDFSGEDFKSLLLFLMSEYLSEQRKLNAAI